MEREIMPVRLPLATLRSLSLEFAESLARGRKGAEHNADGLGDACETAEPPGPPGDLDDDGIVDGSDNCPRIANARQEDSNHDGIGDACEPPPAGCVPACQGRTCGDDGCGSTCGQCRADSICAPERGACVPTGLDLCEPCELAGQCTANGVAGACAQNSQTGETFCVTPCILFCDYEGFDCIRLDDTQDTWCAPPSSTCSDPCLFVSCNGGTHCDGGRCVADPAPDRCAGVRCPGEDEVCDPATGFCVSG